MNVFPITAKYEILSAAVGVLFLIIHFFQVHPLDPDGITLETIIENPLRNWQVRVGSVQRK